MQQRLKPERTGRDMVVSLRSARLRIAGAMLLPLLAAACAGQAPPPPTPGPVVTAPAGPVAVDGTYVGTKQLVRGGDGPGLLCGSMDPLTVTVVNRAFHYVLNQPELPYQPTRAFDATIDADGSFRAVNGPAYMTGSVGAGNMQGQISGDACGYVFQASRQGQ
jgi:hypothetical protein